MKLGIFTALFSERSLDEIIRRVRPLGIEALELATGNYGKPAHIHLDWIGRPEKIVELRAKLDDARPDDQRSRLWRKRAASRPRRRSPSGGNHGRTILLAEKLGVPTVIDFSGCPGDWEGAKHPNFVTVAWPPDYPQILKWQWEEKVIPFWHERAGFARDHGVRIALEMPPWVCGVFTGDAVAVESGGWAGDRVQLRSQPSLLARNRSLSRRAKAGRGDLPRACQGHTRLSIERSGEMGYSTRNRMATRPIVHGYSAR